MNGFKFELHDKVLIDVSLECGMIIGRAEYADSVNNYLIRYKTADGRAVENWWSENAITHQ